MLAGEKQARKKHNSSKKLCAPCHLDTCRIHQAAHVLTLRFSEDVLQDEAFKDVQRCQTVWLHHPWPIHCVKHGNTQQA
jgi:hypothetical protein